MSKTLQLVKDSYVSWENKNKDKKLSTYLDANYKGTMPGFTINGIEEAEKCAESCPFECHSENVTYITEGDNVVRMWDMVSTGPVAFRARMVELTVVQNGKIIRTEALFDTAAFPKEAMEACESEKAEVKKEPVKAGK